MLINITYITVRCSHAQHLGNLRSGGPGLALALSFPGANDVGVIIQVRPSINLWPSPKPIAGAHRPRLRLSIPTLPSFLRTMHANMITTTKKDLAPLLIAPILLHTLHRDVFVLEQPSIPPINGKLRMQCNFSKRG